MVVPAEVTCATVHTREENKRVVRASARVVFGTWATLLLALLVSAVSRVVNAAFVERHDGTDRGRCRRTGRTSDEFSKDWAVHVAATRLRDFGYNFCRPVRTLRVKGDDGRWQPLGRRWSPAEWLAFPAVQRH